MLDRVGVVLALAGIAALGHLRLRRQVTHLLERRARAIEFQQKLVEYVQGGGRDGAAYQWLTFHSVKIQNDLGAHGYMAHFQPPFANYMVPNWAIVLNALPEIRRGLGDSFLVEQAHGYAQILSDALVRYGGVLEDRIARAEEEVRNPISAFQEGIATLLRLPLNVLHWLGLTQKPAPAGGPISRIVAGAISLLVLLSAVVSLVAGWESFVALVARAGSAWR